MSSPCLPRERRKTPACGYGHLSAWLEPRRGRLVSFTPYPGYRGYWSVRFEVPIRGLTVADAHLIGRDAIAVLEAHAGGGTTIESLAALLRAGHAKALLGLDENQLLEAKRSIHLVDEKARLELAKRRFRYSQFIHRRAHRRRFGNQAKVRSGCNHRGSSDARYWTGPPGPKGSWDRLVYPPIEHLDVSLVPADQTRPAGQHLLLITVPIQPRELIPFLVIGAVAGEQVLGNYVGLFQRRGEDTLASGAASIHAGLSAGLALLRDAASSVPTGSAPVVAARSNLVAMRPARGSLLASVAITIRTAPAAHENCHHDGRSAPSRRPVTVCGTI